MECVIVGRPGLYGVFLHHDPEGFGIDVAGMRRNVPPDAKLRTGLSEATATEDDSYDLGWMESLPRDTAKRIPKLRALLKEETDPMDRH